MEYPSLVYTETTVDSVEGVLWLASQTPNIVCYLPSSNAGKNGGLHLWQVEKSSKLIFCGVCYLTGLAYTKTAIHLSVGGKRWIVVFYWKAAWLLSWTFPMDRTED